MPDSSYITRGGNSAEAHRESEARPGHAPGSPSDAGSPPPRRPTRLIITGCIVLILLIGLAAFGILSRHNAAAALKADTDEQAVPTVMVALAKSGPNTEEIVLPGNVQAKYETLVYARTNGYLKKWYVDIGAVVRAGQLLAEIETPEVDDQLRQAEADLATAKANNQLAQITVRRWKALLKTDSVSRQETDEKIGDAEAKAAAVKSAAANVARLQNLESFKRVLAPYNGVVTARLTDIGALINAGGTGRELFRVADISKLRVYVQVPQTYAFAIRPGMIMQLRFAEHPGRFFPAKLVRTSGALDPTARTLLVELQADNPDNQLLSGGYTEVHMKIPATAHTVRLPVSALLFRADGLSAATVTQDHKAELRRITVGRDFGSEVEILAGLEPGQPVILNPPDSLISGEQVRVTQRGGSNKQQANGDAAQQNTTPANDNTESHGSNPSPAALANQRQQMNLRTETGGNEGTYANEDNRPSDTRQNSTGH